MHSRYCISKYNHGGLTAYLHWPTPTTWKGGGGGATCNSRHIKMHLGGDQINRPLRFTDMQKGKLSQMGNRFTFHASSSIKSRSPDKRRLQTVSWMGKQAKLAATTGLVCKCSAEKMGLDVGVQPSPPFPLPNTTDGGGLEVLGGRGLLSTPPGGQERNNAAQPRLICTCSGCCFL